MLRKITKGFEENIFASISYNSHSGKKHQNMISLIPRKTPVVEIGATLDNRSLIRKKKTKKFFIRKK